MAHGAVIAHIWSRQQRSVPESYWCQEIASSLAEDLIGFG